MIQVFAYVNPGGARTSPSILKTENGNLLFASTDGGQLLNVNFATGVLSGISSNTASICITAILGWKRV